MMGRMVLIMICIGGAHVLNDDHDDDDDDDDDDGEDDNDGFDNDLHRRRRCVE